MDLSHGGHLTHGHPMTLPAKIYNFVTYKMKDPETGEIDYEEMRKVALEKKPKIPTNTRLPEVCRYWERSVSNNYG
jgi:glycine hydroxymethyltransferase